VSRGADDDGLHRNIVASCGWPVFLPIVKT
jgi:hypothetical protein